MAKRIESLRNLEIRVSEIVDRIKEIEGRLRTNISPGSKSALLQSRSALISQLHTLSRALKNYGEGNIVRVKFRAYSEGVPPLTYQRYFVNVPGEEIFQLVQYKHGNGACRIEILEVQEIPTLGSLEKL